MADDRRDHGSIWELYHQELASIEDHDLSGGFKGEHPETRTQENPEHAFFSMLEDISGEGGYFADYTFVEGAIDYMPGTHEALWGCIIDFLSSDSEPTRWFESRDVEIVEGIIPLREMPEDLLRSGSGLDRRA